MIPPSKRPIVASIASLVAIVPLLTIGITHGKSQGIKNDAETDIDNNVFAILFILKDEEWEALAHLLPAIAEYARDVEVAK